MPEVGGSADSALRADGGGAEWPGGNAREQRPAGEARACGSLTVCTETKARGGDVRWCGLGEPLIFGSREADQGHPPQGAKERHWLSSQAVTCHLCSRGPWGKNSPHQSGHREKGEQSVMGGSLSPSWA